MTNNLEKIDELVKRTNASYRQAKEALEKCDGDMLEAIIFIENQGKAKTERTEDPKVCNGESLGAKLRKIIKKGNNISLILSKKEKTILNVPLTIAIPVGVIFHKITILAVIVLLLTNHRIRFEKKNGEDMKVNKVIEKISDKVSNITNDITDTTQK